MGAAVNFAFMLPVMMLTFGCTFLVVSRFGSREAGLWAAGFLSAAVAFSVPMFFSWLPIPVQALSADALRFMDEQREPWIKAERWVAEVIAALG